MRTIGLLLLTLLSSVALAQEPDALERAYQKEYAYLLAERDALTKRLAAFEAEARERRQQAEARLDGLQGELLRLQRDAERAEQAIGAVERAVTAAIDGQDVVQATLQQAGEALGTPVPELPEDATAERRATAHAEAIASMGSAAAARLRAARSVRVVQEPFFLAGGEQVDGEVVHVGEIAVLGVSEAGAGALVPVGEGRLQLSSEGGAETARALAAGQRPETVRLFLIDSKDKRVEAPKPKTWSDLFEAGGTIGYAIVALGLVMGLLVLARAGILLGAGRGGARLAETVVALVRQGESDEALRAVLGATGPMARVLRVPLDNAHLDADGLENLAAQALAREESGIDRFGTAILVIASVSPLLGLLGTVSGMIATFDVITEYGTGNPKLLSGGISEALVTTELGLLVAIPGVLVGNLLNTRARSIVAALEQGVALLVHHVHHGDAPEPLRLRDRAHG